MCNRTVCDLALHDSTDAYLPGIDVSICIKSDTRCACTWPKSTKTQLWLHSSVLLASRLSGSELFQERDQPGSNILTT